MIKINKHDMSIHLAIIAYRIKNPENKDIFPMLMRHGHLMGKKYGFDFLKDGIRDSGEVVIR